MCPAAGAGVAVRDADDPDVPGQLLFAPVVHLCKLRRGWEARVDLQILPDHPVRFLFDLQKLVPCERSVQIDRDLLRSHMESHIVISVFRVDQAGDQMFAGMSLHVAETSVPVDLASHGLTGGKRCVCIVDDLPFHIMDRRHMRPAEDSRIIRLSAALRVKRRLVQNNLIPLFSLRTGKDFRLEFADISGIVI